MKNSAHSTLLVHVGYEEKYLEERVNTKFLNFYCCTLHVVTIISFIPTH